MDVIRISGYGQRIKTRSNDIFVRVITHSSVLCRCCHLRSSHFLSALVMGSSRSLSCWKRGMWFTINRTPV